MEGEGGAGGEGTEGEGGGGGRGKAEIQDKAVVIGREHSRESSRAKNKMVTGKKARESSNSIKVEADDT